MKNSHKKQYISCKAELLTIENADVLTAISGVITDGREAEFLIDMDRIFR